MSRSLQRAGLFAGIIAATSCQTLAPGVALPFATHSGPLAISPDGTRLFVAHPDADLVTVVDTASGVIVLTVALASAPAIAATGNYTPAVFPRALALDPTGRTLFVTGQRSGHAYAVDTATGTKLADVSVCAEPIGILPDRAGAHVFIACSQDDEIVELNASDLSPVASVASPHKPWALAWAADGTTLVSTHLLGWGDAASAHPSSSGVSSPGLTAFPTSPLGAGTSWAIADGPPGMAPTVPHGQVRGVYDAMVRPGTNELWAVHMMLGTDTAEPALTFLNTVFPAVSIIDATSGASITRLTVSTAPGDGGAFSDVVSGPRALTFSPDGRFAFLVDTASEDVLVLDARARVEVGLVRPLPGHQPEGVVGGGNGKVYVAQRNTEDVAVIDVSLGGALDAAPADAGARVSATVEPTTIGVLASDPMPANLRLGQHLFHSANSDEYPVTTNHWASCTTCHLEGHSDAVTWRFTEGPRDTPSNAGGPIHTGFLFRTADRNSVIDYWQTINLEQGGDFSADEASQLPLLQALADYVNYAIPLPIPPTPTSAEVAQTAAGEQVFHASHCDNCHTGEWMTDSGMGNAALDLAGPVVDQMTTGGVLLHDVGTCVSTPFADNAHTTIDGQRRAACAFDTPTLRGLSDTAPYLHDGSALTIEDAVLAMLQGVANDPMGQDVPGVLSATDMAALVAYLKAQ